MNIIKELVEDFDEPLNGQNIYKSKVPPSEDDGNVLPPRTMEETVHAIYQLVVSCQWNFSQTG